MKVLVLGCGPTGLTAVHAAAMEGHDVLCFSKPRKSRMNGAQYLHQPIPKVGDAEGFEISYDLMGHPSGYRMKVYGPTASVGVSPESLVGRAQAWDIRAAYDDLWALYGAYVQPWEASPTALSELLKWAKPDLAVSSIPAPVFCDVGHAFTKETIWSTDKALKRDLPDNSVLCNGNPEPGWYRVSRIQGYENTEWPGRGRKPPIQPMWAVEKPIKTNCNCFPQLLRTGRYGRWQKGVLVHQTFDEVTQACRAVAASTH